MGRCLLLLLLTLFYRGLRTVLRSTYLLCIGLDVVRIIRLDYVALDTAFVRGTKCQLRIIFFIENERNLY